MGVLVCAGRGWRRWLGLLSAWMLVCGGLVLVPLVAPAAAVGTSPSPLAADDPRVSLGGVPRGAIGRLFPPPLVDEAEEDSGILVVVALKSDGIFVASALGGALVDVAGGGVA